MTLTVISPDKKEQFDQLQSVILPSVNGEMEILAKHAESFIKLREGEIIIRNGSEETFPSADALCHIKDDEILVIL